MDVLIPILIFGILAAISFARKMQEQQRLEELRRSQRENQGHGMADLPEATRRMIYGQTPPVPAQRRYLGDEDEGAPEGTGFDENAMPNVEVQEDRRVEPIPLTGRYQRTQGGGFPPLPQGEPTVDEALRQLLARRQQLEQRERMLRDAEAQRQRAEQERRAQEDAQRRTRLAQQQTGQPQRRKPVAARQTTVEQEGPRRPLQPTKQQPAQRRAQQPRTSLTLRTLIGSGDELRRGIILTEILGPPRGLQ